MMTVSTADAGGVHRETFRYGTERDQECDLWRPRSPAPMLAIVLHGGFWRSYFGRRIMDPICQALTELGWAAWNIEYRRIGSGGGYPETLIDVAAAIDLLRLVAPARDLNPRPIAIGHSAGGQLALWAATRGSLPDGAPGANPEIGLAGVLGLAAVTDLLTCEREGLGVHAAHEFLGGSTSTVLDRYSLASPACNLPVGLPVRLVHGSDDGIVPPSMSCSYRERAREAGDDIDLTIVAGADHFAVIDPEADAWKVAMRYLSRISP